MKLRLYVAGWAPTCESRHSWELDSAVSLEGQAVGNITQYHTQSPYLYTENIVFASNIDH